MSDLPLTRKQSANSCDGGGDGSIRGANVSERDGQAGSESYDNVEFHSVCVLHVYRILFFQI